MPSIRVALEAAGVDLAHQLNTDEAVSMGVHARAHGCTDGRAVCTASRSTAPRRTAPCHRCWAAGGLAGEAAWVSVPVDR